MFELEYYSIGQNEDYVLELSVMEVQRAMYEMFRLKIKPREVKKYYEKYYEDLKDYYYSKAEELANEWI